MTLLSLSWVSASQICTYKKKYLEKTMMMMITLAYVSFFSCVFSTNRTNSPIFVSALKKNKEFLIPSLRSLKWVVIGSDFETSSINFPLLLFIDNKCNANPALYIRSSVPNWSFYTDRSQPIWYLNEKKIVDSSDRLNTIFGDNF